jgi:hypothetical protein
MAEIAQRQTERAVPEPARRHEACRPYAEASLDPCDAAEEVLSVLFDRVEEVVPLRVMPDLVTGKPFGRELTGVGITELRIEVEGGADVVPGREPGEVATV